MDLGTIDLTQLTQALGSVFGYAAPVFAIVAGAWVGAYVFRRLRNALR